MERPLVNNQYTLEKFPGKGGWTYAAIPEVRPDKKAPFGWVKVKGQIDDFGIKSYHLMPMGNGQLFLPVKAEIRKKIGKKEGDQVHVVLYRDTAPVEIPEELLTCLRDTPEAYDAFLSCTDGEKKVVVDWIYSAKRDETKVERMAKTIGKLANREK